MNLEHPFTRFRRKIYNLVEVATPGSYWSQSYDKLMIIFILGSILPLCFKTSNIMFDSLEGLAVDLFTIDYLLRWLTADLRHPDWGAQAFLRYPFTFLALVDLLSILPSMVAVNGSLKLIRLLRLVKSLKALKLLRYSTGFQLISSVIKKEKDALLAVCYATAGYVFLSALTMFSVEPTSFHSFFDAIYWSVITLTTVGYGDVHPVSTIGRTVSIISSFVGVAIIALPSGIISAGFMSELEQQKSEQRSAEEEEVSADL